MCVETLEMQQVLKILHSDLSMSNPVALDIDIYKHVLN